MADPARLLDRDAPGYDEDFCLWAEAQAALLRSGRLAALDIENIAEEIEDMSKSVKHTAESNLVVLLKHLLKYRYQPEKRSGSWSATIREHRRRVNKALVDSPSLRRYLKAEFSGCYESAREQAADETGLPPHVFPVEPFLDLDMVLDKTFWPEPADPDLETE